MNIQNPDVKITLEVTLKELRVIEYALRNIVEDEYQAEARGMATDILVVMKGNGIEMIQEATKMPEFAEIEREKVEIL